MLLVPAMITMFSDKISKQNPLTNINHVAFVREKIKKMMFQTYFINMEI